MNTQDKVINDLAIQLANKTIECANYKALYEEAQEQIQQLQLEKEKEESTNIYKKTTAHSLRFVKKRHIRLLTVF